MIHISPQRLGASAASLIAALLVLAPGADARINVVTLPGRDSIQLTIYNSVDLTLVKETRLLTFRKGLNRLEFSWANTLIDPTSVEFRAVTHATDVDVLDVSFPPRVTNTLEWRINSDFAGEVRVEISYFTSGISWGADYLAESARNEKTMNFAGNVRITNNSGEDYDNAQVRLVVGVIRLIEEIAELARAGQPSAPHPASMPAISGRFRGMVRDELAKAEKAGANKPAEIVKEGLSEYFLYTVEGRDTIPNGWSKRLPSFKAADVPITSFYRFENEQWGDKVMRYYRFTNSVVAKLGTEPLPDGAVKAFRFISDDNLYAFVGSTTAKYIPVNERVDLELGNDLEVRVKPTLVDWTKTDLQFDNNGNVKGWTTKETWEIEVQNSKEIDVALDIRRTFQGDWSLETQAAYEKMDAAKIKFVVPLKPKEKRTLAYTVTVRHGTNATR